MTPESVNDFATYLALTGAIPSALAFFTFVLGRPRTWHRSFLGWVLALLLLSIMLVFVLVLGRRLAGEYPGYQWTAIIVYALLTIALWLVFVIIIHERRRGRALGFVNIEAPHRKVLTMSNTEDAVPAGNGTVVMLDDEGNTVTADAETGEPTAKPTGKIVAVAVSGAVLVVVVACLGALTPELLVGLGPWAGVVLVGATALANFLSGYLKRP